MPINNPETPSHRSIDIIAAYREFLGREPENADVLREWINSPGTLEEIRTEIRDSEEGQAYRRSRSNEETTDPGLRRTDIIALYQELLGRDPESDAVVDAYLNSQGSLDDIRDEILNSEEGKAYAASKVDDDDVVDDGGKDSDAITAAYQEFLGRDPENEDVITEWINSPGTLDEIRDEIRNSEEGQRYTKRQAHLYNTRWWTEGVNMSATDPGVHAMIERDRAGWLEMLRTHASGFKDSGEGSNWEEVAQDELNAAIRQMRYAPNAGTDPKRWLDEAKARITRRIQADDTDDNDTDSGDNGNPNAGDNGDPNAGFGTRPTTPYSVRPTAASTFAPSQAQPGQNAWSGQAAPPSTPPPQPPFMGRMSNLVDNTSPTTAAPWQPPQANNAWNQTDANYQQAGADYAAGPNGANYTAAPWEQSRRRFGGQDAALGAPRGRRNNQMSQPYGRRDRTQFARQDARGNQANATLARTDFDRQMDNWLRAYNQWNQQGSAGPAPDTGQTNRGTQWQ